LFLISITSHDIHFPKKDLLQSFIAQIFLLLQYFLIRIKKLVYAIEFRILTLIEKWMNKSAFKRVFND